uniref:DUF834 domain-containing protein n=1 Tax=Oryza meridionalis TaxID=40149 RepID=A0A0E0EPH6_9ORYZ
MGDAVGEVGDGGAGSATWWGSDAVREDGDGGEDRRRRGRTTMAALGRRRGGLVGERRGGGGPRWQGGSKATAVDAMDAVDAGAIWMSRGVGWGSLHRWI